MLIWVQKDDEAVIKDAFTKTLTVRKLSPEAKKLADMYFFRTLVRIHRAGEGVAYTGLKSAETEVEPGIEAADKALEKGSAEELLRDLNETIHQGIHEQFTNAIAKKNSKKDDVAAGREYVKAYVEFIHYVERLYQGGNAIEVICLRTSSTLTLPALRCCNQLRDEIYSPVSETTGAECSDIPQPVPYLYSTPLSVDFSCHVRYHSTFHHPQTTRFCSFQ